MAVLSKLIYLLKTIEKKILQNLGAELILKVTMNVSLVELDTDRYDTCWRINLGGTGPKTWLGPTHMDRARTLPGMVAVKDKVRGTELNWTRK